jgi:hypothetical protein
MQAQMNQVVVKLEAVSSQFRAQQQKEDREPLLVPQAEQPQAE